MDGMIRMYKTSQARKMITEHETDLVLHTRVNPKWGITESTEVKCYTEHEDGVIGFPRFFIRDRYPKLYNKELLDSRLPEAKFRFKGELWPEQKLPVRQTIERLKKHHGGILQGKGGRGKTVCALAVIAGLRTRTLIIVDKEILAQQWKDQISKFLGISPEEIGSVGGGKSNIKPITVALVQSLYNKELPFHSYFGLVVVDECHKHGALQWSAALQRIGATYRLGLSATPERKDGLELVLRWQLGYTIALIEADTIPVTVARYDTGKNFDFIKRFDPYPKINVVQSVVNKSKERNEKHLGPLLKWCLENRKQTLVLSTNLAHLLTLSKLSGRDSIGYLTGKHPVTGKKTTKEELEHAKSQPLIFGTFQMVKEGMDLPTIDTVILATPSGDTRQATYRAARKSEGKTDALIIDLVDQGESCSSLWNSRSRRYEQDDYQVVPWKEVFEMAKKTAPTPVKKKGAQTVVKPASKKAAVPPEKPVTKKAQTKVTNTKTKKKAREEEEEDEEEEAEDEDPEDEEDTDEEEEESEEDDEEEPSDEDLEEEDTDGEVEEDEEEESEDEEEEEESEDEDTEEDEESDGDDTDEEAEEEEEDTDGGDDDTEEDSDEESDTEDEPEKPARKGGRSGKGKPPAPRAAVSGGAKGKTSTVESGVINVESSWRSKDGEEGGETESEIKVRRFSVPPEELAHVSGDLSHTISLGNYESVRVGIGVRLPCYANVEDILQTQNTVEEIVRVRLEAQISVIKKKLEARKAKAGGKK